MISILIIFEILSPYLIENEQYIKEDINDNKEVIIIPLSSLGENPEIIEYFDELDLSPFYIDEQLNRCYYLLDKYNSCFNLRKNKIEKCQKLYMDKIDKEKCESIKEQILNQALIDFEDIFKEENVINENISNYYEIKRIKNKSEVDDNSNNDEILKDNINKDCVEYGLSEDNENLIVCTKYE